MTTDLRTALITTPADREIRVEREFEAPREAVFAALTDPELVCQWWGPRGSTATIDRFDARSGGDWRVVISSDGRDQGFRGTFREVTPPERIVRTFEWEGMPGHVLVETATLAELDGSTRLVVTSLFHTAAERDGMLASGMERGTNDSYNRLDELLGALATHS